ncbi:hypothetical protein [Ciceribacter sp. RN22]|uniref:hypothetical protein n=1 Tax=Ciceribacter sp. RN22 TaxID=2954932 RepID=UPI002092AE7C|nr:hypothetical protein [Ciceribacter sp. RN22]MCO6178438.1 hypothetical protein [Ciceribacter sp. RN22]
MAASERRDMNGEASDALSMFGWGFENARRAMRDDPQNIPGFGTAVRRSLVVAGAYLVRQRIENVKCAARNMQQHS